MSSLLAVLVGCGGQTAEEKAQEVSDDTGVPLCSEVRAGEELPSPEGECVDEEKFTDD